MKYVYLFSEGNGSMRELLGGKGANLAEMTNLGIGFITTNKSQEALVIKAYYDEASKSK